MNKLWASDYSENRYRKKFGLFHNNSKNMKKLLEEGKAPEEIFQAAYSKLSLEKSFRITINNVGILPALKAIKQHREYSEERIETLLQVIISENNTIEMELEQEKNEIKKENPKLWEIIENGLALSWLMQI